MNQQRIKARRAKRPDGRPSMCGPGFVRRRVVMEFDMRTDVDPQGFKDRVKQHAQDFEMRVPGLMVFLSVEDVTDLGS